MRVICFVMIICIGFCMQTERNYAIGDICKENILVSSKNGFTKNYYTNSINIKSIGHYEKGMQQGFWKHFYRNGKIKAEGHYEEGQKQGFWKEYHKNGRVKSEGHIDNCEPIGYWKFYNKNNDLVKEINY